MTSKRGRTRAGGPRGPGASPATLAAAVLPVYREIDLPDQLREALSVLSKGTGAAAGIVFPVEGDGDDLPAGPTTLPEGSPLHAALLAAPPPRGAKWITRLARVSRLGPLTLATRRAGRAVPAETLIVPLRASGPEVVAVMLLFDPPDGAEERAARLEETLRPALDNALKVRAIRDLTIKDDTAECFNRRYFEDFVLEEIARANRFKTSLSLIFFDMDNLKEVNSTLGHAMGSRTIREVSERVQTKIRRFDKLFRFGGDEFCIVLPETEWHGALEVAERVREAVASRPFLVRERGEGRGRAMTASFGVASYPLHARTKEDLVIRADRAMQSVKVSSKNAIGVADLAREDRGRG